jgi:alpha-D-glucose phosphate-specific phosphoglucomutase
MSIHFGTSGWRAIIDDEFTFPNVRRVSHSIAQYIKKHRLQDKGVIVGYDTRFLSKEFAETCAQVLAADNIRVFLTARDTPTPVIAYQILKRKAGGAINITASHNPPEYNGIKFSTAYGGPAPVEVTREIEKNIKQKVEPPAEKGGAIEKFDPLPAYLERIKELVDFKAIRRARLKIGVDVLYGCGRGYLDRLLADAGCRVTVLHDDLDPSFGGLPPEPAKEQLKELVALVRKNKLHLGLALDGDADRFGVIDRDGAYINANQVLSLLTHHLIGTRPKQKTVARTVATTHMVDVIARKHGMRVIETPVGFKHIGQELAKGNCLIGGEESGGLSIGGHIPEKDGILACLLLAELVAIRGKSLGGILKELYREVGFYFSARNDSHLDKEDKPAFISKIEGLSRQKSLADRKIAAFNGLDGYKFIFPDESWLMLRMSGTEPVVRCYCEAKTKEQLKELQQLGQSLVGGNS